MQGAQAALATTSLSMERSGGKAVFRDGSRPVFTISATNAQKLDALLYDTYAAALAFIRGELDVEGDLVRAIQWQARQPKSSVRGLLLAGAARLARAGFARRSGRARNIQFHYDRSNRFYATFLDSGMVYSCGYFQNPDDSIEQAQTAKLDYICRKLRIEPGERFLDIGCGWGGLLFHAADHYRAVCTGCTLSHSQTEFIEEKRKARGRRSRINVIEADFQQVRGTFDKIASVGMFEHVGHRRLRSYFSHIAALLAEDGLFLNHAIARPQGGKDGPETLFLQQYVFPGGDLLAISEVTRAAEEAGFEVLDIENLRPHYALTCRAWVKRLQASAEECLSLVSREVYRTWLLYLAASAAAFHDARTDIYQTLLAKRSGRHQRPMTRGYLYTP